MISVQIQKGQFLLETLKPGNHETLYGLQYPVFYYLKGTGYLGF